MHEEALFASVAVSAGKMHAFFAISSLLMRFGDPVRFADFDFPLPFPGVFGGLSCEKLKFFPFEQLPVFANSICPYLSPFLLQWLLQWQPRKRC